MGWSTRGRRNQKPQGYLGPPSGDTGCRFRQGHQPGDHWHGGHEGIGKTVLQDLLTGHALKADYRKPTRSQNMEKGKVKSGQRILINVVPGQEAHPRYVALADLFHAKKPVDGVIHVVANGFGLIREPDARRVLVADGMTTIELLREYQKKREIEDLKQTLKRVRDSHLRHHAPRWMIIAVDKVDLYHDTITDAADALSPSLRSGIPKLLNELRPHVGQDNFRWTALPVCGLLEEFEWNGNTVRPQFDNETRLRYYAQFLRELEAYCQ